MVLGGGLWGVDGPCGPFAGGTPALGMVHGRAFRPAGGRRVADDSAWWCLSWGAIGYAHYLGEAAGGVGEVVDFLRG